MRNPWKLTSLALAGALAASTLVPDVTADPQPRMRAALDSLREAQRSLQAADHDKGGHRAKALNLTKAAIDEVQAGMRFDNRR